MFPSLSVLYLLLLYPTVAELLSLFSRSHSLSPMGKDDCYLSWSFEEGE